MQYITKYPKTVTLMDGMKEKIFVHKKTGVDSKHQNLGIPHPV